MAGGIDVGCAPQAGSGAAASRARPTGRPARCTARRSSRPTTAATAGRVRAVLRHRGSSRRGFAVGHRSVDPRQHPSRNRADQATVGDKQAFRCSVGNATRVIHSSQDDNAADADRYGPGHVHSDRGLRRGVRRRRGGLPPARRPPAGRPVRHPAELGLRGLRPAVSHGLGTRGSALPVRDRARGAPCSRRLRRRRSARRRPRPVAAAAAAAGGRGARRCCWPRSTCAACACRTGWSARWRSVLVLPLGAGR